MKIYSDGYTIGRNPSNKGGGYVIMDEYKQVLFHEKIEKYKFTNNEAELRGVVKATNLAQAGDIVITDSNVAWCWVIYRKCKARPDLREMSQEAYINIKEKGLKLKQEGRDTNLAGNYIEFELGY